MNNLIRRIGIVGGGQLGRMLCYEAFKKGIKVAVLDPDPDAPAMQIAHHPIIGNYDSEKAIQELIDICDVITYEFENVEPELLIYYQNQIPIHPNPKILKISRNRNSEKQFARHYNISIPELYPITTIENHEIKMRELYYQLKNTNKEWIIKTSEGGYDGKNQIDVNFNCISEEEFINKIKSIFKNFHATQYLPIIIEEKIKFEYEFSIIACGFIDTYNKYNIAFYKPFINEHRMGILRKTFSFLDISIDCLEELYRNIAHLMQENQYIGLLTIEFFYEKGKIYFNEMAPRPHNSGHLTIEGYNYSQFEQHIRAISGLPIHTPILKTNASMLNLISFNKLDSNPQILKTILNIPNTFFHNYGKVQKKQNRKMGHITILNEDKQMLIDITNQLEAMIYE